MSQLQLFCLPYSGASAMFYNRWRRQVPEWLKLHPLELPGRGIRFGESLATDISALAEALARQIREQLLGRMPECCAGHGVRVPRAHGCAGAAGRMDAQEQRQPPYAVLGHSLGALLGFELVHALRALGCPPPLALCASGASAPTRREDCQRGYDRPKSDEELIAELRKFQGTPEHVLANQELMSLALPVLRADFLMCGRYRYRLRPQLCCHLHVFAGKTDDVSARQLAAWADEISGTFSLDMFDGGHFFIHEQEPAVLRVLSQHLAADLQQHDADAAPLRALGS